MNILIVTAHPSPLGQTHVIANTYAEAKRAKNNIVQIVDLYADEYKVTMLDFLEIRNFTPSKVQLKFQEQIKWADEIVVVHPIWWGTPPSIMKSWVELTFWPKVAYHYSEKGKLEKLLTGKTAKVFVTCGGPAWYHYFIFMPLTSFWKVAVFGFVGIDITKVQICGNLDIYKNEKRAKHIEQFLKKIKKS
jgi:putative NADPH-quinone reductase